MLPPDAIEIEGVYDIDTNGRCWRATIPAPSFAQAESRLASAGFERWNGAATPLPGFGWFRACPFSLEEASDGAELRRRVSPMVGDVEHVSIREDTGSFLFLSAPP